MSNPYAPGTFQFAEYEVWSRGERRGGGEIGFLRELHDIATLRVIQNSFHGLAPQAITRVSSIWIDKYPLCEPTPRSGRTTDRRELGDLAIIIRKLNGAKIGMRMMILQGKVARRGWQSQANSRREIELMETCPEFEVFPNQSKSAASQGVFNLVGSSGFPSPPYAAFPFWNFLLFAPHWTKGKATPSHLSICWPSRVSTQDTFLATLRSMANSVGAGHQYGADVHKGTPYPEWRRLFHLLWRSARAKLPSILPGGPWSQSLTFEQFLRDIDEYETESKGIAIATTGFQPGGRGSNQALSAWQTFQAAIEEEESSPSELLSLEIPDRPLPPDPPHDGDDNGTGCSLLVIDLIEAP